MDKQAKLEAFVDRYFTRVLPDVLLELDDYDAELEPHISEQQSDAIRPELENVLVELEELVTDDTKNFTDQDLDKLVAKISEIFAKHAITAVDPAKFFAAVILASSVHIVPGDESDDED